MRVASLDHTPNFAQCRFYISCHKFPEVLLGAGVGLGKTEALCIQAVKLAILNPGLPGLVVSHVFRHMNLAVRPRIISHLKRLGLFRREHKTDHCIYLTNGSVIQYGSADNPSSIEGLDLAWLLGDELRFWKEKAYNFAIGRVRIKAAPHPLIAWTSTLDSGHWMADKFRNTDKKVVYGKTHENAHNLKDNYIIDLKRSLSPKLFRQYVHAEWMNIGRTVYGAEFCEKGNIREFPIHKNVPVFLGIDFGYNYPSVIIGQHFKMSSFFGADDVIVIFDELQPEKTPTLRLIPMIKERLQRAGLTCNVCYVDPAGLQHSQEEGSRSIDMLEDAGFNCVYTHKPEYRDRIAGTELVRARLLGADFKRRLIIHPRLVKERVDKDERGIVQSIQKYKWEGDPPEPAKKGIHTHCMDALRYVVVNIEDEREMMYGKVFHRNRSLLSTRKQVA